MARWRFLILALLALAVALAGNSMQTGKSAGQELTVPSATLKITDVSGTADRCCVVYALSDMGYDSDLGKWIAQTIPEVIEPNSWKESGVLRYYAPKNVLIINHSAAMQAKLDGFLKNLKASLPKKSETSFAAGKNAPRADVVPAVYNAPAVTRIQPRTEASSYPVPAPAKAPKHLFHFLIRYEGDGIIDDNVVKFMKMQAQSEKKGESDKPTGYPAVGCSPVMAPAGPASYSNSSVGTPYPSSAAPQGMSEKKTADKKADKQP